MTEKRKLFHVEFHAFRSVVIDAKDASEAENLARMDVDFDASHIVESTVGEISKSDAESFIRCDDAQDMREFK